MMKKTYKKKISTAVVPFFPISYPSRIKRYIWPVLGSLIVAGLFGLGAFVLAGGLSVTGAPYLSPFKGVSSWAVKRIVLALVTVGSFIGAMMLAKWCGWTKPKPQPSHVTVLQNETRRLSTPMRISNIHDLNITHYNTTEDECTLQTPHYFEGIEKSRTELFLPLQSPVEIEDKRRNQTARVTHYREFDGKFLVYYPAKHEEVEMTQACIDQLSSDEPRTRNSSVSQPTRTFIQPQDRCLKLQVLTPEVRYGSTFK